MRVWSEELLACSRPGVCSGAWGVVAGRRHEEGSAEGARVAGKRLEGRIVAEDLNAGRRPEDRIVAEDLFAC